MTATTPKSPNLANNQSHNLKPLASNKVNGSTFKSFDFKRSTFALPRLCDSHLHLAGMGKFSGQRNLRTIKDTDLLIDRLNQVAQQEQTDSSDYLVETFGLQNFKKENLKNLILKTSLAHPKALFKSILSDGHGALYWGESVSKSIHQNLQDHQNVGMPAKLLTSFPDAEVFDVFASNTDEPPLKAALVKDEARIFFENTILNSKLKGLIKSPQSQSLKNDLLEGQKQLLQNGFTHCRDLTSSPLQFEILQNLIQSQDFKIIADLFYSDFYGDEVDSLVRDIITSQKNSQTKQIQVKGLKIFLDGSLNGKNLDCSCQHLGPSAFHFEDSDILDLVKMAQDKKIELAFHCIGDLAFEKIISAFLKICETCTQKIHLEHCEFINKKSWQLLKQVPHHKRHLLNFHFQPAHWLDDHHKFEEAKWQNISFFAWDELLLLGFENIYFGSDAPVSPSQIDLLQPSADFLKFLQTKTWPFPWWRHYSHPEATRSPLTFTYFYHECPQTTQSHFLKQIFIHGEKINGF